VRRLLGALLLLALALAQTPLEREVMAEANAARVAAGLPALAFYPELYQAARAHAEDMLRRGYFGHEAEGGPGHAERLWRAGVYELKVAENLYELDGPYLPSDFARRAVEGWLESPGHRRNLLDPGFTHTAVAVAAEGERFVAVQEFAYRPFALSVARERAEGEVVEVRLSGRANRKLAVFTERRMLAEVGPGEVSLSWFLPAGARPVLAFRQGTSYYQARCPQECARLGVRFEVGERRLPGYRLWLSAPGERLSLAAGREPGYLFEFEGQVEVFAPRVWRFVWVAREGEVTHRIPVFP